MDFKFDPNQEFQKEAVAAIVDLFEGQPRDLSLSRFNLPIGVSEEGSQTFLEIAAEVGAVGNQLVIDSQTILKNLEKIQDRNGLEIAKIT